MNLPEPAEDESGLAEIRPWVMIAPVFENSSHTPFHEERELYMRNVNEFLDRVDAASS